ncbi:hypothetical protein GCM10022223_21280 [Kineosporia mesophila]|uniref:Uncharacterized protein n=1 Tax=Kineosporia mesophila TaxID=566012 RepID=A0ABP6ZDN8_9ACTN|nr:hypothetical protein [Kineosporia mesophila]MCD5350218.1 hypothetical protein [Kineosporia mesophila]
MTDVAGTGTVQAWVESPFQLLGALEAHAAGRLGRWLVVLPRKDVEPLVTAVAEVTRLGLPAGVTIQLPSGPPRHGGGDLAVGDAFSGEVHRLLVQHPPRRLVLLDDGRSTRRVMDALIDPDVPLVRPHVPQAPHRAVLARLAKMRLRRMIAQGRVRVITALPLPERVLRVSAAIGLPVEPHNFTWLRSLPGGEAGASGEEKTIVLGTSMVANRLIKAQPYLSWIRSLADQGPVVYRAHRRENASTLSPLTDYPGITMVRGEVPAEISLRGLSDRHRVVSLPSTAVSTLRLIVPEAEIQEFAVPEEWWMPGTPDVARHHLVPDGESDSFEIPQHSSR